MSAYFLELWVPFLLFFCNDCFKALRCSSLWILWGNFTFLPRFSVTLLLPKKKKKNLWKVWEAVPPSILTANVYQTHRLCVIARDWSKAPALVENIYALPMEAWGTWLLGVGKDMGRYSLAWIWQGCPSPTPCPNNVSLEENSTWNVKTSFFATL